MFYEWIVWVCSYSVRETKSFIEVNECLNSTFIDESYSVLPENTPLYERHMYVRRKISALIKNTTCKIPMDIIMNRFETIYCEAGIPNEITNSE